MDNSELTPTILDEMINEFLNGGHPSESDVQRFSDLTLINFEFLKKVWNTIPNETRKRLLLEAVKLSDESIKYEYSRLAKVAFEDPAPELRRLAIELVRESEDRTTARSLRNLLLDSDHAVAAAAAEVLGNYVLLIEFGSFDEDEGGKIIEDLRTAAFQDKPPELRAGAIEALSSRNLEWIPSLILDAYYDDDERLRLSAIRAMGRTASSGWLEYIYEQLEVRDSFFRMEAILAVSEIADESSIERLSVLFEDDDSEIAEAAVESVALIGGEVAVDVLVEFAKIANETRSSELEEAIKTASGEIPSNTFEN